MSKTITSPVKEFPGTVKLPDRLTMPQALVFEQSIADAQSLGENATQTKFDNVMLTAICQIVEKFELDGFGDLSLETFPATPRKDSAELIAWIYGEILKLYNPDVPNE